MEYYNISKCRLRYVIPFEVNIDQQSFEQVCSQVDHHRDDPYAFFGTSDDTAVSQWVRSSLRKGEQDVYPYIIDEFAAADPAYSTDASASAVDAVDDTVSADGVPVIEKMGCFWRYSLFADRPFPIEYVEGKDYEHAERITPVSICDMGLYIFRSGIGLLWYEIQTDKQAFATSKELICFQNVVKELNRGDRNRLWIKGSCLHFADAHQSDRVPFLPGSWIAERLQFLHPVFWAGRKNSYAGVLGRFYYADRSREELREKSKALYDMLPSMCPDKALLFSYVVFDRESEWQKDEDSLRTAYYLTRGYTESYEMSHDIDRVVRNPFSNVYWAASREGCGYFAWAGASNRNFLNSILYAKIMNDYFLLYIRAVYQSYSLMHYTVSVSGQLPNDCSLYVNVNDETERLSRRISRISTEINLFLVKSVVTSVSYVHHQNEFYEYLIERLQIREDAESVTAGLAALKGLQHETLLQKEKDERHIEQTAQAREAQREKKADNMFQIGLGLMTFLVVISAVTDSYGIVSGLSDPQMSDGGLALFIVLFCICMIILAASITIFVKSIRNLNTDKSAPEKTEQ